MAAWMASMFAELTSFITKISENVALDDLVSVVRRYKFDIFIVALWYIITALIFTYVIIVLIYVIIVLIQTIKNSATNISTTSDKSTNTSNNEASTLSLSLRPTFHDMDGPMIRGPTEPVADPITNKYLKFTDIKEAYAKAKELREQGIMCCGFTYKDEKWWLDGIADTSYIFRT